MKLKHKLLAIFLCISLLPVITVGIIAGYIASTSLEELTFSNLTAVREIKKSQIESYFEERKGDIEILADTVQQILDFNTPDQLVDSAHDSHAFFKKFIKAYGYYDLFLIDSSGDIFYTVTREADYQTNLITGLYNDSGLGKLFQRVQSANRFSMADFSRYAPSNNEPATFIALPFTSANGVSVVVALQLSIDKINVIMQQREGMGETGESYLIGSDYLMRSDSYLDPTGHSVVASFAGNIQQNGVKTEAAKAGLNGTTDTRIIIDYNGNPVLSAFTPINIDGTKWVLLSEIDAAEAFSPVYSLYWTIFIVVVISILIIASIAIFTANSILRPLGGEPHEMQSISESIAEGDLTISFNIQRGLTGVYGAMHRMVERLQNIIGDIVDTSSVLASTAEQTSTSSLQASVSMQQQRQSIEQVAAAIEEMSASVHEVSENVKDVAGSSQSAKEKSNDANNMLNNTINVLGDLGQEINRATDVIQELARDTRTISSVLEVIRGIADQTNLLALNAAIEAARAGESGRGFAVVADEVRNLAQQTQESTKNIEDTICKLQSASDDAVNVMAISQEKTDNVITNAHTTAKAINHVDTEIESISKMTDVIATATEQQHCAVQEISQNITAINDVAHENTETANQVSAASQQISDIAEKLNGLTKSFTLSSQKQGS